MAAPTEARGSAARGLATSVQLDPRPPGARRRTRLWLRAAALGLVLGLGGLVRVAALDRPPLTIDEAESSINALTILEHGVPTDRYLGKPIFENTLVRRWPGHPEYEFRDLSYSSRGLSVYHGWLPLYAIAASLRLHGIAPDSPPPAGEPPRVLHAADDMTRRTIAARWPGVLFGMAFLVTVFAAGRALYGEDAAWIALVAAAFLEPSVRIARQARYYSATTLLSTLCLLLGWRLLRRGRVQDGVLLGLGLTALFHTHVLTFVTACAALALAMGWVRLRSGLGAAPPRSLRGGLAAAVVVGLGVVPWAVGSGFFEPLPWLPAARDELRFPGDYVAYLREHLDLAALLGGGALAVAAAAFAATGLGQRALPARVVRALSRARPGLALCLLWMLTGYFAFLLLVPAPSCFLWRLSLGIQGPGLVLGAILLAVSARAVAPRWLGGRARRISLIAVPLGLVLGAAAARDVLERFAPPDHQPAVLEMVEHLRAQRLGPDAKLYAVPTQHLPLTYYSGLPVQSVAPVRRRFLERTPGEVLVLDAVHRRAGVSGASLDEAAALLGRALAAGERWAWEARLGQRLLREDLAAAGHDVSPPLEALPPLPALAVALERARRARPAPDVPRRRDGLWQNPPVFRGHEAYDLASFWPVFFYRYVDPASRSGANACYAGRIEGAPASVLPSTWVVYRSPPRARATTSIHRSEHEQGRTP